MNAKELALSWNDYLIETRRYLHRHPERSMHETETCRYILESLASFGIEGKVCGGTGVYADLGGKKPGKTIMLRADMDALPVEELNEIPYKSENPGMMHACGHDGHMAMLLTAARILKGMEEEIPGTVRVCFQPGEEVGLGALGMMKDGVLEGVDVIFGMHLWADVPTGKISVAPGPRMASCDEIRITVKGKGCHGSMPHQGVDAVLVTSAIINNLQSIVSRETSPLESDVVTVATIKAGTTWNAVAEDSFMTGTTRTFSPEIFDRFPDMIGRIVKSTGEAFRADCSLEYKRIDPPVINDPALTESVRASAEKIFGKEGICDFEKVTASEDFGHYIPHRPCCYVFIGVRNEEIGAVYPQHSGHYTIDENVLANGAALYVQTAMDWLSSQQA